MKRCESIMTRNPVTCGPRDTLAIASRRMRAVGVGALPVVDGEDNWLVGIITDRDITVGAVALGLDPRTTHVEAAMTREVVTCLPDDVIHQAIELTEERQLQRLPIVDDDGRLVGIVTRNDLTRRVDPSRNLFDFLEEVHAED